MVVGTISLHELFNPGAQQSIETCRTHLFKLGKWHHGSDHVKLISDNYTLFMGCKHVVKESALGKLKSHFI